MYHARPLPPLPPPPPPQEHQHPTLIPALDQLLQVQSSFSFFVSVGHSLPGAGCRRMDLRDRIRLLLLLLLKQAVKRRKCNNNQSCRTEFATTINSNGLCWILSHALLRCKPLNCAALTAGSGAFLKRNCTRIIRTPVRRKSPKRLVFTQSTMSRKLSCKEQLKPTLASVPRNRGPQFAKRSGRQRVRTFCDAIASTEEPSSYAEKVSLSSCV